jgi:hypothetical protein
MLGWFREVEPKREAAAGPRHNEPHAGVGIASGALEFPDRDVRDAWDKLEYMT